MICVTFPPISITTSAPFTFDPVASSLGGRRVGYLYVYNEASGADVYHGPVPRPAVTFIGYTGSKSGTNTFPKPTDAMGNTGFNDIYPGYVYSNVDNSGDDGLYVVRAEPKFLVLSGNNTFSTDGHTVSFTPPAIDSDNGIPLVQGTGEKFVSDQGNHFLNHPRKFVVASGTAVLRVEYGLL